MSLKNIYIWIALGLIIFPIASQAEIIADQAAPGNQQPTILSAPNGVPLVNIRTPSPEGVSHNTYRQFDVQPQGVILNNSSARAQTQLGGWVQNNPYLTAGSARVILNEVNSNNPSLLRGYIEVAGSRAQVVIANPSGITCDGCGFVNAHRATLTTGTPIFNNGNLDSYRVQQGTITITGAGLNTKDADYTALIARATQLNAGVWAKQLKITQGTNRVNANHTAVTPITGVGEAPTFAIDVAALGGMYADKITLIGTEAGVGVRNAGNIGASVGEVMITADGLLENSGRITSAKDTTIDTQTSDIKNSGTIHAVNKVKLHTTGNIDNQDDSAGFCPYRYYEERQRRGTKLAWMYQFSQLPQAGPKGEQQDVVSNPGKTPNNPFTKDEKEIGGILSAGQHLGIDSGSFSGYGKVLSEGDLSVKLAQDYVHTGEFITKGNTLFETTGTLINHAKMAAGANLDIKAASIENKHAGELVAKGNSLFETAGTFINHSKMAAGANLDLKAARIENHASGTIEANRIKLETADNQMLNNWGLIDAKDTTFINASITNLGAGKVFGNYVALGGKTIINGNDVKGAKNPVIAARTRLDFGVTNIKNKEGALLFSAGDLAFGDSVDSDGHATGKAEILDNESATIEALGKIDLAVKRINNIDKHFETPKL